MKQSVKSFKVFCLPLTKVKLQRLKEMVIEYAKFYNYSAKFQPSLPDKYREKPKKGEVGLYGKWVKSRIIQREHIGALEAFSAINDACTNFKASHILSCMEKPNIVKVEGQNYRIIKLGSNYGIQIGTRKNGMYIPLVTGKWDELISYLENNIGKDVGQIVYNLHDNSISIPFKIPVEKFKKLCDVKTRTFIGVDLGINNIAVLTAIKVDIQDIKKITPRLCVMGKKNISLSDIPVEVMKVKVLSGFGNKHRMKHLRIHESKRRKLRKDVGHRRSDLRDHTNHRISAEIVKFASLFENPIVVFEKGLGNLVKSRDSTWSPADVRTKAEYKLNIKGIWTFDIYPGYTSINCHKCGAVGIRPKGTVHFHCPSCGLGATGDSSSPCIVGQYNADVNASFNIALRGLYILTRKEKTVGYRDGIVAEPNVPPNDSVQEEVNTPDIREALDGISNIRNDFTCRKDDIPVVKTITSVISETISRSSLQVSEQPMGDSQETASQKIVLFSSSYKEDDNSAIRTEYDHKTNVGEVVSQTKF